MAFSMLQKLHSLHKFVNVGSRPMPPPQRDEPAVRYLIQINMFAREPVPGSRRDRYRLVDDSWYEVTLAKITLIKALADAADQGVAAAGGADTPAGARLANMRDFYLFVQEALPGLLDQWAMRKAGFEDAQ